MSTAVTALALLVVGQPTPVADAPPPVAVRDIDQLVRMSRCDLDALYRGATIGTPPRGVLDGRAIFDPGSKATVRKARRTRLVWQGKVIDDERMVNRLFGFARGIPAAVSVGPSWFDGAPTQVLDYEGTSKLFGKVRDEVREVSPGVWLGLTYVRKDTGPELVTFFALQPKR